MGKSARNETGCIVAAHLHAARTERCCTVEAAHNAAGSSLEAILEIRAYGHNEDDELILIGGRNANLRTSTEKHRANIEGASCLVRWDEVAVELHDLEDGLFEESVRKRLHQNGVTRVLQTLGILVHAEHTNPTILATKSLQTFEACLTIVQHSGGHVHCDFLTLANTEFSPSTIAIGASHIVRSLAVTKPETAPIDLFCHFQIYKNTIPYIIISGAKIKDLSLTCSF